MTILTAWALLSIGFAIGFVAASLFAARRNEMADSNGRLDEHRPSSEAFH